jgi:phosphoglycolate phosphatase
MPRAEKPNSLIIFDLDGTLINIFDYHIDNLKKVVERIWNVSNDLPKHKRYGIPQIEIMRRICEAGGKAESEIAIHLPQAMEMLTTEMSQNLPEDLRDRLLPGVQGLLAVLSTEANVYLALATGTLGGTAEIILKRSGLDTFFPVGAYGHECYDRQELVRLAQERSFAYYDLDPVSTQVVTVGDAPSDIEAGKSIGARTVSVASSSFSMEDLARYEPEVQLESFAEVEEAAVEIIGKR